MNNTIVIFGASGDLTSRKLVPALYQLYRKKRLPEPFNIVGFARTSWEDDPWRAKLEETTKQFAGSSFDPNVWAGFAKNVRYHPGDIGNPASFDSLKNFLSALENENSSNRVYYLATAPKFYAEAIDRLAAADLVFEEGENTRRVIIEKPFGTDLKTAQKLNDSIHQVLSEEQIYRIDHYLGKETVNNLLVFRFANAIFEPIWNRNYIEHIQITANEEVTIGSRAAFYETAGILRDMFQNHLMQILTFVMMEPPARFNAKAVRDEKVKVLQSVRRIKPGEIAINTLRGQYKGYHEEKGVAPDSRVPTYGAIRLNVDNWRWKDVPIYLRSAKATGCRTTQVMIQFKQPPHSMFSGESTPLEEGNRLLIQIQPSEGIRLYFQTKVPDTEMEMRMSELDFNFKNQFRGEMPEAYERLILDALHGDASLFARNDEVEEAWKIIDPIQETWDNDRTLPPPEPYEIGSWGPDSAETWLHSLHGHYWFDLCPLV